MVSALSQEAVNVVRFRIEEAGDGVAAVLATAQLVDQSDVGTNHLLVKCVVNFHLIIMQLCGECCI